ncbi:DUF4129 domain-containing protein [Protaetiibacter intestinalis]|uniref:DUF4129 domain-containing protein n=1 Tax=Protaetiibacter intestinalis TaxID=2419774 RepID=A0A387B422_9MICO|nr:DUF4129 domain-containing protein [Protaetiibacter intestinalis]AYF97163.1 DUF4129 domain-containing protein [Protaetiibacter intestinalis]
MTPLTLPFGPPLDPDAEEARRLLREELAKTKYQWEEPAPSGPNWIDELLRWFQKLLDSLSGTESVPAWVVVLVIVGIAVIVVAFLVFGVPRLRARSEVGADELFEADDVRDAAAMRRDADAAAREGAWALAIAERFRAIARAMHERALLATLPGSTAHDVARRAARALPEHGAALERAAYEFDAVRYLGDRGDRDRYETMVALDRAIEHSRPAAAIVEDQVDRSEWVKP